jgi:hypothetical protein
LFNVALHKSKNPADHAPNRCEKSGHADQLNGGIRQVRPQFSLPAAHEFLASGKVVNAPRRWPGFLIGQRYPAFGTK